MIRPFTDQKIVFDPEEEQFYLVSQGVLGSPRPFRQVKKIYKDGDVFKQVSVLGLEVYLVI
jgi:hypothetical protein